MNTHLSSSAFDLLIQLKIARIMIANTACADERAGQVEDADFARSRLVAIDAVIARATGAEASHAG